MREYFVWDERLGIDVPHLEEAWEDIPATMQQDILVRWERIRGHIPDRIQELEAIINAKQQQLNNESNFGVSCRLNSDIADLASVINDLWLWYRADQDIAAKVHR